MKFKKALALSIAATMGLSLVACGSTPAATTAAPAATDAPAADTTAAAPAEDTTAAAPAEDNGEGKVLNIYAWNEEFQSRLKDHYPGYEAIDGVTGKIGDVTVNWVITPNADNAYQDNLDAALLAQDGAEQDKKVDLFLVEADYALKYVNTPYTVAVKDLGITDAELANQYQYTKDIVTDSDGVLKGVSWQGCPGVMIYNRKIAQDVFGSDDPAVIQPLVSDWTKFREAASQLKAKGYYATATVNDTFRVFSNNVTTKWVDDETKTLNIDQSILDWVAMSKEMVDAGETTTFGQWGDEWSKGFYEGQGLDTFAYFGPAWLIDFCMQADDEASIAAQGGWAATEGPMGFYWGGTWICAAAGTDNASLVADIMRKMTMDEATMVDIVKADNDFVNNKPAMEAMAQDTSYGSKVLGGQNALAMFCAGADKIDLSHNSNYDQGCVEAMQEVMKSYFDGNSSYDEAIAAFYEAIQTKYPAVNIPQ